MERCGEDQFQNCVGAGGRRCRLFVLAGTAYAGAVIQTDPGRVHVPAGSPTFRVWAGPRLWTTLVSENWHDVVATKNGPDGKPLFSAPLARGGETKDGQAPSTSQPVPPLHLLLPRGRHERRSDHRRFERQRARPRSSSPSRPRA